MSSLAPLGPVYQAGTLSGNPLATAAGTTVLNLVTPGDYEELSRRVATFARDFEQAIASSGLYGHCPTQGPLMGLFLSRQPF
jgi:glutamate-1-semialdehyde 2,1-aminomutase